MSTEISYFIILFSIVFNDFLYFLRYYKYSAKTDKQARLSKYGLILRTSWVIRYAFFSVREGVPKFVWPYMPWTFCSPASGVLPWRLKFRRTDWACCCVVRPYRCVRCSMNASHVASVGFGWTMNALIVGVVSVPMMFSRYANLDLASEIPTLV